MAIKRKDETQDTLVLGAENGDPVVNETENGGQAPDANPTGEGQGSTEGGEGAGEGQGATDENKNDGVMDVSQVRDSDDMNKLGAQLYSKMSAEEQDNLGSKRNTLHYVRALGRQSVASSRLDTTTKKTVASLPVEAVELLTDEELLVPVIEVIKPQTRLKVGVDPDKDITYKTVAAGEKFVVTVYEALFLFMRDEFAGFCEAGGDPEGLRLVVRPQNLFSGDQKLPTPYLALRDRPIKAEVHAIDQKNAADEWEPKPEYADRFAPLFVKTSAGRGNSGSGSGGGGRQAKKKATTAVTTMLSLQRILGVKK